MWRRKKKYRKNSGDRRRDARRAVRPRGYHGPRRCRSCCARYIRASSDIDRCIAVNVVVDRYIAASIVAGRCIAANTVADRYIGASIVVDRYIAASTAADQDVPARSCCR
ncbi:MULTISPECIES: hypothetical protein [Mycetohabitans]|uniref:hypothetical protein n=1 Tax=Mycetohabitans TaxID=2571159 RepID=UPI001F1643E3|nr:hypothetical protein [Mycetohabitans sp. B3]MCF2134552.1 hypothetical protein [Mycetohabitans sp. B3]